MTQWIIGYVFYTSIAGIVGGVFYRYAEHERRTRRGSIEPALWSAYGLLWPVFLAVATLAFVPLTIGYVVTKAPEAKRLNGKRAA